MGLSFETRSSDSPWIASVWTCRSEQVAEMTSVASHTWGLVFWRQHGTPYVTISGPESRTDTAPVPDGASFLGIQFTVGTGLRSIPVPGLVDSGIALPDVGPRRFRLAGRCWETPNPDDAEALVARLVGDEVLIRDPLVAAARIGDRRPAVSDRTLERHFRAATGLTQGAVDQIERVRTAAELLASGEQTGDVVDRLGYYDEPHLARALRRYVGRTARQLREGQGGAIALDLSQRATS